MAKSLDGVLIKRAHRQETYTEEQINELAQCMDPVTGYLYFVNNFFFIQHPVKGKIKLEPFEYQERLMASYHNYRFNINMMPRQSGKALALDTRIPTPSGWTTMRDIKVGDLILSSDGKPTTVTFATEVMTDHICYKIEFDHGEEIIADEDHLWEINTGFWRTKNKVVTTKEIFEYKHSRNTSIYVNITDPIEGSHQELPIPPYTFGLWLGDGSSNGGAYTQSILDNLEMIKFIQSDGFNVSEPRVNSSNSEVRTIYKLRPLLVSTGVYQNKHIPDIYLRASINQRLELLQGLMDTDGTVNKEGQCEFYQKKYHIVTQVRELLSSLGIKSRISVKLINDQSYYTITFTTTRFTVFKLPRKSARQLKCKGHQKNTRLYVKNISMVSSLPVRCIQVDNPSHLFLCGNTMIPTHNTTCAAGYLLWYGMFHMDQTILVAAHKYTGSQEIMQRIRYAYELCPDHIRGGAVNYNKGSIEFDNGSRIVSATTTGNTGRGMAISLLYCDEFAFVQPNIAEEFWTSISPTLATGGRAIITSTPNSDEDEFALIWRDANKRFDEYGNESDVGINGFHGFKADWWEHPDRDEAWKNAELGRIGEERFRREYGCLTHDATVTVRWPDGQIEKLSMGDIVRLLS